MNTSNPRVGRDGDKPGKYELIDHIFESSVDPGDTVKIDLYITGYGNITSSKLYFSPPPVLIFEEGKDSIVTSGLKSNKIAKGDMVLAPNSHQPTPALGDGVVISWGRESVPITRFGFTLGLGGVKLGDWSEGTAYFDADNGRISIGSTPSISTEAFMEGWPPIRLVLKLKKDVRPGIYTMGFVFTYFNGTAWQNSSLRTSITIRNAFQRHEKAVTVIGIVAAAGSSSGLIPYIKAFCQWIVGLF
jgi:hypothetical protein